MMKRTTRTIDVPKLRRNLKGRGRIAETMCCGGFAYVKLLLLWLGCIALDLFIGFRFELLYPVWLLVRSCYDSFRFQGLVSSLQYSAFSAFFVCATVTTDIICFILLPVQLLFFLASTYVWVLLVWQTAERGIGSTQLLLWVALVSFEYNWRYRGDSPLQLLKSSTFGSTFNFLTGGLLTNSLELRDATSGEVVQSDSLKVCQSSAQLSGSEAVSGFLSGFGVALTKIFSPCSPLTSDLCRPFAAHCIGYPVVTLGFGLKTYFRLWRVKRRQREVSRANEIYCKLLTEAIPLLYEGPKLYSRCIGTALHDQEQLEYESEFCPGHLQSLAICASPSSATVTQRKNSRAGVGWKQNSWKQASINTKKFPATTNESLSARKERSAAGSNDDDDTASSVSLSVGSRMYLWRVLWDLMWSTVLYIFGGNVIESPLSSLDDRISLSSNEVESEDEMMEQEEILSQPDDTSLNRLSSIHRPNPKKNKVLIGSSGSCSRTKGGRSRGRHVQNHAEYMLSPLTSGTALSSSALGATCTINNNLLNLAASNIQQDRQMYNSVTNTGYQNSVSGTTGEFDSNQSIDSVAVNGKVNDEYDVKEELETLRNDLRVARCHETELRYMLQQYISGEKQLKGELAQLKSKQEQSENKLANVMRAREQDKSSMQLLEKRLIEAQAKKNELEKELTAEKRSKVKEEHAALRALAAAQSNKTIECGEACKARKADLERELRALRRDLKVKEDLTTLYEDQLIQLRQHKETSDFQEMQTVLQTLRDKNVHLEKSLSAENRLKQELFRALSEARAQMAEFRQQLLAKDTDLCLKETELMNLRSRLGGNDTNDSTRLSPSGDNCGASSKNIARCGAAGNSLPIVNDVAVIKLPVTSQQEVFNAASNVYMPYTFNSHTTHTEHSLFDGSVTQTTPTVPSNSVSSSPASHLPNICSDVLRFTNSKFNPSTANPSLSNARNT